MELNFGCEIRLCWDDRCSDPLPLIRHWKKHSTQWYEYFLGGAPSSHGFDEKYVSQHVEILGATLTITDVLRMLTVSTPIILWSARPHYPNSMQIEVEGKLIAVFNLSLPLSAPENEAACEAVLKLLDSENDRVFVCREGDDYANCL